VVLEGLREGLRGAIDRLLGRSLVDERALREFVRDVQRALIQADVNVKLVLELSKRLEEALRAERPPPGDIDEGPRRLRPVRGDNQDTGRGGRQAPGPPGAREAP
jgi:signal recognition particle subunit FFH/SRP54 (srp54)